MALIWCAGWQRTTLYSYILPWSKNMHARSIRNFKLSESEYGCLSPCGPEMSWQLVQSVTVPLPYDSEDRLLLTPVHLLVQLINGCTFYLSHRTNSLEELPLQYPQIDWQLNYAL